MVDKAHSSVAAHGDPGSLQGAIAPPCPPWEPDLLELRREAAVADAVETLQKAYDRAGRPRDWLTADVRMAEHVVNELWLSARHSSADDAAFHAAVQRCLWIARRAILEASSRASLPGT